MSLPSPLLTVLEPLVLEFDKTAVCIGHAAWQGTADSEPGCLFCELASPVPLELGLRYQSVNLQPRIWSHQGGGSLAAPWPGA